MIQRNNISHISGDVHHQLGLHDVRGPAYLHHLGLHHDGHDAKMFSCCDTMTLTLISAGDNSLAVMTSNDMKCYST